MSRFCNALLVMGLLLLVVGFAWDANAQFADQPPNAGTDSQTETAADSDPTAEDEEEYVPPEKIVREVFGPPPEAVPLTRTSCLWIDRKRQRVYLDGYVTMRRGALEMFACPIGTKEHESVVATLAKAREIHAALLAIEATPGTPVRYLPEFVPATGQVIRVWVCWRDEKGKFQVSDARQWIKQSGTKKAMDAEWVFAGSSFWLDPSDGREYYQADSGDMICVSNFSTAMLDVTISSSAESDELQFTPYQERIPEIGTPIRLILAPIPNPTDKPVAKPKTDPNKPPTEKVLPNRKESVAKPQADAAKPK